jgi:hypothetical protein
MRQIMVGSDHDFVEVRPGIWRFVSPRPAPARSDLPMPNIISDTMDPVEQVDGKFYTSKRAFRAVGRALGLTEVGNDPARFKKKTRASTSRENKAQRRRTLERALAQYRSGRRARREA